MQSYESRLCLDRLFDSNRLRFLYVKHLIEKAEYTEYENFYYPLDPFYSVLSNRNHAAYPTNYIYLESQP